MKNTSYKQKFYEKERRRQKAISKMKPEQQEAYVQNLLSRSQKKSEIKRQIFNFLGTHKDKAIVDVQKFLGINRTTLNHWISMFVKEGWIRKVRQKDIQGRPTYLILNQAKIKKAKQYSYSSFKSFEEAHLKSLVVDKILREIDECEKKNLPYDKQQQVMVKLFKQFREEGYGAKMIFLMYSDRIKLHYKFSITDKGEKALEKIKKRNKLS